MVGQNLGSKSVQEFLKWFHASFEFLCVFYSKHLEALELNVLISIGVQHLLL